MSVASVRSHRIRGTQALLSCLPVIMYVAKFITRGACATGTMLSYYCRALDKGKRRRRRLVTVWVVLLGTSPRFRIMLALGGTDAHKTFMGVANSLILREVLCMMTKGLAMDYVCEVSPYTSIFF